MTTSNNPSCYYHPSRNAITKCESCGKLICVECKNIFQQTHSAGTPEHRTYYVTRNELCTPCFYDKRIKAIKIGRVVPICFGTFFLVIGIIFFRVMYSFTSIVSEGLEDPFIFYSYVPLIMFTCIGFIVILVGVLKFATSGKKITDMEAKKTEFLKSVASASSAKGRTQPVKREYCHHCGNKINPGEKICEQCGENL